MSAEEDLPLDMMDMQQYPCNGYPKLVAEEWRKSVAEIVLLRNKIFALEKREVQRVEDERLLNEKLYNLEDQNTLLKKQMKSNNVVFLKCVESLQTCLGRIVKNKNKRISELESPTHIHSFKTTYNFICEKDDSLVANMEKCLIKFEMLKNGCEEIDQDIDTTHWPLEFQASKYLDEMTRLTTLVNVSTSSNDKLRDRIAFIKKEYYEKELIQRQEHSTYVKKTKEEKHVLELEIQRLTSQLQEHRNALTQLLAHTDMEDTETTPYNPALSNALKSDGLPVTRMTRGNAIDEIKCPTDPQKGITNTNKGQPKSARLSRGRNGHVPGTNTEMSTIGMGNGAVVVSSYGDGRERSALPSCSRGTGAAAGASLGSRHVQAPSRVHLSHAEIIPPAKDYYVHTDSHSCGVSRRHANQDNGDYVSSILDSLTHADQTPATASKLHLLHQKKSSGGSGGSGGLVMSPGVGASNQAGVLSPLKLTTDGPFLASPQSPPTRGGGSFLTVMSPQSPPAVTVMVPSPDASVLELLSPLLEGQEHSHSVEEVVVTDDGDQLLINPTTVESMLKSISASSIHRANQSQTKHNKGHTHRAANYGHSHSTSRLPTPSSEADWNILSHI